MALEISLTGKFFAFGIFALSVMAGDAFAQSAEVPQKPAATPGQEVSCLTVPTKLSQQDIDSFLGDPQALLKKNEAGGLPLVSQVRELAGSSSSTFDKISELTKGANSGQRSAIASGLANAAYNCGLQKSDAAQNYVLSIQTFVAQFGDPAFASAFQEASKEIATAAVGPGAGGVAVGGGDTSDVTDSANANRYRASGAPVNTTSGTYSFGTIDAFNSRANFSSPN